jgi:hypothetical protein
MRVLLKAFSALRREVESLKRTVLALKENQEKAAVPADTDQFDDTSWMYGNVCDEEMEEIFNRVSDR